MPLTLTPKAVQTIREIQQAEGKPDTPLRVGVVGGGCSGMSYNLGFDDQVGPMDKVFESEGVRVVVDAKSYLYLNGMILDYTTGLNGKGFVFQNPNAKNVCGCGESFTV